MPTRNLHPSKMNDIREWNSLDEYLGKIAYGQNFGSSKVQRTSLERLMALQNTRVCHSCSTNQAKNDM